MRDLASDEKAGANASLCFTYQHWYAALFAIERFGEMDDYLIILEFKEDVLVNGPTSFRERSHSLSIADFSF